MGFRNGLASLTFAARRQDIARMAWKSSPELYPGGGYVQMTIQGPSPDGLVVSQLAAVRIGRRMDWLGLLVFLHILLLAVLSALAPAAAVRAPHPMRTDHYLDKPIKVLTMASNDTQYREGLQFLEASLNRTNNADTPMELEIIRVMRSQFLELGWRAKILYALKSLRHIPDDQLVIWADSKDTIFLPCGRDLRKAFQAFQTDIVLGGYNFQFPDAYKAELFPEIPLICPEIPFPTWNANYTYFEEKYLNAGIIVGRSWALRHYLGGAFLRYQLVDMGNSFHDQAFWADMYLAQFYDNAATVSMHPSIAIDSGYMLANQVAAPYSPVGEGYWQCDKSRFTACILHASGADNYIPLRKQYLASWSKSIVKGL